MNPRLELVLVFWDFKEYFAVNSRIKMIITTNPSKFRKFLPLIPISSILLLG